MNTITKDKTNTDSYPMAGQCPFGGDRIGGAEDVNRVVDAERSDPGATQLCQMSADAQRGTEITGQRADVGPRRAVHRDVQIHDVDRLLAHAQ